MTSTSKNEPALTAEELRKIDAYWKACNYQESAARTLGLRSRPDFYVGPSEPRHPQIRSGHDLPVGSGTRCAGRDLELLSGRDVLRDLPGEEPGRSRNAETVPRVFVSRPTGESLHARSSRVD